MERAYDDWKEGRWSRAPYIDMLIPSQIDPPWRPTVSTTCRCSCSTALISSQRGVERRTPRGLRTHRHRHDCAAQPGFQIADPARRGAYSWDIEREVGLTEGNIFQGELTFDQLLFNRPVPGYAQYARPCAACICAARARIRAAASWARRAPTPHAPFSRISGERIDRGRRLRLRRDRRGPQRPGVRLLPGAQRPLVLVLEAASGVGGAAITREFTPDFACRPAHICCS